MNQAPSLGGHVIDNLGHLDEQLGGAAHKVAAEDIAAQQVAGVEGGPTAGGDALGRARPRQDDDLGHAGRQGSIGTMSPIALCWRGWAERVRGWKSSTDMTLLRGVRPMREEESSLVREIEPLSKRWLPRWYYVLAGG